ncbi:hypothetical protein ACFFRR_000366 [Megaselia abdita]
MHGVAIIFAYLLLQFAQATPLTLDEIRDAKKQDNVGASLMCFQVDNMYKTVIEKSIVTECCKFYRENSVPLNELVKCIEIKFRTAQNQMVFNINDAKRICKEKVDNIPTSLNETLTGYKVKLNLGCFAKCVSTELEVLKDDVFIPDNLIPTIKSKDREEILEKIKKCHKDTNRRFTSIEKYSCQYFYFYNECFEKYGKH